MVSWSFISVCMVAMGIIIDAQHVVKKDHFGVTELVRFSTHTTAIIIDPF